MKYQKNVNNKIQCTVCPRFCTLKEGQRGYCHIRQNLNNEIVLTSYAHTTGLAIDPIEKKPLYHFYPSSRILSFGTIGCNIGCQFCQNWNTSKSTANPELMPKVTPAQIAELAVKHNCQSVAFTYNEPTIFLEYAIDTAKECKARGIKTVAVSNGYINEEPREEFYSLLDAINIDLKAFTNDFYKRNCAATLEPVLESIKYAHKTGTWLELTTLLIEGENDSEEELSAECSWIVENLGKNVPLHFSAFHPQYKFNDRQPTTINTLIKAYEIAKSKGLNYVYTGNIHNPKTSTTYCSGCNEALIVREGHYIAEYNITQDGTCKFCETAVNGRFV